MYVLNVTVTVFFHQVPKGRQGNFKRENILARKASPPLEPEVFTPDDLEKEARMKAVKFTYLTSISLLKGDNAPIIKDIRVLGNGHVVMADGNNRRLLISEIDGIKQSEFRLPGKPFCLERAPDDTVAVSLYEQGKVVLLDVFKRQVFREVVITCYGIVFTDDYLILNCGVTGLKAMDMNGEVFEAVKGVRGDGYLYIGTDGNVYCNCSGTNQILCCNMRRNLALAFSKLSMEHPLGTTVDDEGFIYEVGVQSPNSNVINEDGCRASESVHMISCTGKHHRLVLTKKDGVNNPYAIFFDRCKMTLLIANDYGESVVVFKKDERDDEEKSTKTEETLSEYPINSYVSSTLYSSLALSSPFQKNN